ncbi:hypothetical protein Tsubulata_025134 [Turnera subulata]|uniref:Protein kinase domain-containing protein n=1 Tax=Turnera subulata TaxID=218843 RepID=A0A9Q0J702_9ROSI|nr:hypothetical protein Tsubulata_025134 [Turnera subulata]
MTGIRMLRHFFLTFLGILALEVLVHGQDQAAGFISIDCGLPPNTSYLNPFLGLVYTSDSSYVETGVSSSIATEFLADSVDQQEYRYVRSFPEGVRNCYKIEVAKGTKYLIRATFFYGNYDGQYKLPAFDLYFGPNKWLSVQIRNVSKSVFAEIINIPTLNYVHVCLVKTESSTPFVSALELRPLRNDNYVTESGSLVLFNRVDMGSVTNGNVRFPDDVYDRIWIPFNFNRWSVLNLNTSQTVDYGIHNAFLPPSAVMSTAAAPTNDSEPIVIDIYNPQNESLAIYYYMYLAEIVKLEANQSRVFNISLNGQPWVGPISPNYLHTTTAYSKSAASNQTNEISIFKVGNSTLPPLLNALEVYYEVDLKQSPTDQGDVDAMMDIKSTYGISRNWQGDPCAPEDYVWEGLNCSYNGTAPPRIISLDLSGNHLTGNVPSELYARAHSGSLSLRVDDNPGLCISVSCEGKRNNTVVKVVASIAAVFVLVAVLVVVALCIFKRGKDQVIFSNGAYPHTLDWGTRIRIAIEAAQGLEYLHNGCKPPIIHRDVKTTNILLTEKFQAKLSDFGLSRTFPVETDSHVSTVAAGTPGYLDPEYWGTNWLTEKSDVYSFGVVLLEIITSRAVIVKDNETNGHIIDWVRSVIEMGDIKSIIDPKLHGSYDVNSGWRVIELALSCVSTSPADRPSMYQVVAELNECFATLTRESNDSVELMSLPEHSGLTPLVR